MEFALLINAVLVLGIVVKQGMRQTHTRSTIIAPQAIQPQREKAPPIGASDPQVQAMLQDLGIDAEPLL